jgi:hypothetical protein
MGGNTTNPKELFGDFTVELRRIPSKNGFFRIPARTNDRYAQMDTERLRASLTQANQLQTQSVALACDTQEPTPLATPLVKRHSSHDRRTAARVRLDDEFTGHEFHTLAHTRQTETAIRRFGFRIEPGTSVAYGQGEDLGCALQVYRAARFWARRGA